MKGVRGKEQPWWESAQGPRPLLVKVWALQGRRDNLATAEVAQQVFLSTRSCSVSELYPRSPQPRFYCMPGKVLEGPARLCYSATGPIPLATSHCLGRGISSLFPGEGPSQQPAGPVSCAPHVYAVWVLGAQHVGPLRLPLGGSQGVQTGPHHVCVHACPHHTLAHTCSPYTHKCWCLAGAVLVTSW